MGGERPGLLSRSDVTVGEGDYSVGDKVGEDCPGRDKRKNTSPSSVASRLLTGNETYCVVRRGLTQEVRENSVLGSCERPQVSDM